MSATSAKTANTSTKQSPGIAKGRTWQTGPESLIGDWSQRKGMVTVAQTQFDAWADSIELPHGPVYNARQTLDGVYVQQERGQWVVFVQERGSRVHHCGEFTDYRLAKRQALATEYLHGILLPTTESNTTGARR